jgi:dihydrofolate synthase / folylpolyglutamate synthase
LTRRPRPAIQLGLHRVRRALEALGHPEREFASIIVAGTNGKGSVSAFLDSVLRRAGRRAGLFTSPHLVSERERVRVDGRKISAADWKRLTRRVAAAASRARVFLTEFETHALAAFCYFREKNIDIAVAEVGLGGRLDAVNALPAPEATVIASIGHDHLDWLGPTLRHVLAEKLGVCRPGAPLVQSLPPALEEQSRLFCRDLSVPTRTLGRDFFLSSPRTDWKRLVQTFDLALPEAVYKNLRIGLLGRHQSANAALAAAVWRILNDSGWRLPEMALRRGLAEARWPGRFQILRRRGEPDVILDGAHNAQGAASLAAAYLQSPWGGRTATLIFSCLKDKDAAAVVEALRPLAHRVLTVPLPSSRSRRPEDLRALWSAGTPAEACAGFAEAWRAARRDPLSPVVVTGSLYLVGEALKFFRRPPA